MKLIYCRVCHDIVKLRFQEYRTCWCTASGGKYTDRLHVEIDGEAVPLGILNESFRTALSKQPDVGLGPDFKAFVIERNCTTISRTDRPKRLRPKPGPNDWIKQLDSLTVNQRNVIYALCIEPSAHTHSTAFKVKHHLTSGGITSALKTLKSLDLIRKDSENVWWVKDVKMLEWLHARLRSQPTDESDEAWARYYEGGKAGIIRFATESYGSEAKALAWLNSSCHKLCDHVPAELLARSGGFEELCQFLAWRNV